MSMPRITRGLGSFTARAFNRMSSAVESVERASPGKRSFRGTKRQPYFFLAMITDRVSYAGCFDPEDPSYDEDTVKEMEWNWIYDWVKVDYVSSSSPKPSAAVTFTSSGVSGTATCSSASNTGAINIREYANFSRADDPDEDKDPFMGPGQTLPRDLSQHPEPVEYRAAKGRQIVVMYAFPIDDFEEGEPEWWYFFDQDNPIECESDGEPFRASTLDISLDLGSLTTPELDHSNLDFGGIV